VPVARRRGPLPKPRLLCVLCNFPKTEHYPKKKAEKCSGFVPSDLVDDAATGEANRSSKSAAGHPPVQQRTPDRRGKLSAIESKRARQTLLWASTTLDRGANFLLPGLWTKEDLLQVEETTALVEATYAELEVISPKALQWLAKVFESSVHVQLAYVVACVAAPRLERRGLVPPGTAFLITMAPVAVAAGGPPEPDRRNGDRQEHADGGAAEAVVIPDRPADQSGQANGSGLFSPFDPSRAATG